MKKDIVSISNELKANKIFEVVKLYILNLQSTMLVNQTIHVDELCQYFIKYLILIPENKKCSMQRRT